MAFTINNGPGYDDFTQTWAVISTTNAFPGRMYVASSGEHVFVERIVSATSLVVARGINATNPDAVDDGEVFTEVSPDSVESDDLTSGANWTISKDPATSASFGVGGLTLNMSGFTKGMAWFNTEVAEWTTLKGRFHCTLASALQLWGSFTIDDPFTGYGQPGANEMDNGYALSRDVGTTTVQVKKFVAGVMSSIGQSTANTTSVDDVVNEFIITKQGSKLLMYHHQQDERMAVVIEAAITYAGGLRAGIGAFAGDPILRDFELDIFGGGGGGGGSTVPRRGGMGPRLGLSL